MSRSLAHLQDPSKSPYVAAAEKEWVYTPTGKLITAPVETRASGLAAIQLLSTVFEAAEVGTDTGNAPIRKANADAALTTLARLTLQHDKVVEELSLHKERANQAERARDRAKSILQKATSSSAGGGDGGRLAASVRALEVSAPAVSDDMSELRISLARCRTLEAQLVELEVTVAEQVRGAHQRSLDAPNDLRAAHMCS